MYKPSIHPNTGQIVGASILDGNILKSFTFDERSSGYQKLLDDIIEQGAACWDGDIPAEIQTAADAKKLANA